VADGSNPQQTATQNYTVTIFTLLAGTTPNTLLTGTANAAYSQSMTSTGGVPPYAYQLAGFPGNALPPGMNLSSAGVLNGTPTSAGTFTFDVLGSDNSVPAQGYSEFLTVSFRPQPPTGLISAHVNGTSVVSLGWNASISGGVSSYNVYRATTSGGPYTLIGSVGTGTNFTDGNAAPGTTVFYVVTAVAPGTPSNLESANSAELQVVVN
jgi:large repetitive protein